MQLKAITSLNYCTYVVSILVFLCILNFEIINIYKLISLFITENFITENFLSCFKIFKFI